MKESEYQNKLIKKIKNIFKDCIILKNDSNYCQGIPDLIILFGKKWCGLEVKKNNKSHHQPNQDYWINKMNEMSYASFISPENEKEVLNEMERTFGSN